MKYCSNCGAQLPDDARFCGNCGTPCEVAGAAQPQPQPQPQPEARPNPQPAAPAPDYAREADGTVRLCEDGKYRWVYELDMMKNSAVLGTLFKIFGFIFLGIWVVANIAEGFSDVGGLTMILLLIFAGISVLVLLSYWIVAKMNGGKYCVLFTMDETGLMHTQLPRQFKKAQVAGWIAMLAGVLAGNPTTVGAGILAATRNSLISNFSKVRSIQADPGRNLIKVNSPLSKNQVYVDDAQFQFVLDFIRQHCPNAK